MPSVSVYGIHVVCVLSYQDDTNVHTGSVCLLLLNLLNTLQ